MTATFSRNVTVDETNGSPSLKLVIDPTPLPAWDPTRQAVYAHGSGTAQLVFGYTVALGYEERLVGLARLLGRTLPLGDADSDGIAIAANGLTLNGGTIRDSAGHDAALGHDAVADRAGHKVDGLLPLLGTEDLMVNGATLTLTYNEAMDENSTPPASAFGVTVDGETRTISDLAVAGQTVSMMLDPPVAAHDEVLLSYTVPSGPGSAPLQDLVGNDARPGVDLPVVNVTPAPPPAVAEVTITSDPGADSTYAAGDAIEVAVRFDRPVQTGGGRALVALDIGGVTRQARRDVRLGDDVATLGFRYTVVAQDRDADGIEIPADALALNGSYIKRVGVDQHADITHAALPAQPGHKVDGVKPVLLRAKVAGATLTLTWDEALDGNSTPDNGTFALSGGAAASRSVTRVAVSGAMVSLTLNPAVTHDETGIKVGYAVPTGTNASPLRDAVGNAAAAFSGVAVTNETADADAPTVASIASGAAHPTKDPFAVTVTFSEAVTGLTANEIEVTQGVASNFAGSGAAYTLDIEPPANFEGDVTVTVPADAAVDAANLGNVAKSRAFAVDTRAPALVGTQTARSSNGAALTLTWHEALAGAPPGKSAFSVAGGDAARSVTAVSMSGSAVRLTVGPAATHGETGITVTYTVPAADPLRDAVGNAAAAFSGVAVTNETADAAAPTVASIASGATHPTRDRVRGNDHVLGAGDRADGQRDRSDQGRGIGLLRFGHDLHHDGHAGRRPRGRRDGDGSGGGCERRRQPGQRRREPGVRGGHEGAGAGGQRRRGRRRRGAHADLPRGAGRRGAGRVGVHGGGRRCDAVGDRRLDERQLGAFDSQSGCGARRDGHRGELRAADGNERQSVARRAGQRRRGLLRRGGDEQDRRGGGGPETRARGGQGGRRQGGAPLRPDARCRGHAAAGRVRRDGRGRAGAGHRELRGHARRGGGEDGGAHPRPRRAVRGARRGELHAAGGAGRRAGGQRRQRRGAGRRRGRGGSAGFRRVGAGRGARGGGRGGGLSGAAVGGGRGRPDRFLVAVGRHRGGGRGLPGEPGRLADGRGGQYRRDDRRIDDAGQRGRGGRDVRGVAGGAGGIPGMGVAGRRGGDRNDHRRRLRRRRRRRWRRRRRRRWRRRRVVEPPARGDGRDRGASARSSRSRGGGRVEATSAIPNGAR